MTSALVLLILVAQVYGIATGAGPWLDKVDKSHLAFSYSTQDKAASFNNPRFIPLPSGNHQLHTVRSPTPVTPITYGFKPILRTAPNLVYIQAKGPGYQPQPPSGLVYPKPNQQQSDDYEGFDQRQFYSVAPSPTAPAGSSAYTGPTPGPSVTFTPPANSYGPPKSQPANTYGPPKSQPADTYGPPKSQPADTYGPPKSQPADTYGPPKSQPANNYGPPPKPSEGYGAPSHYSPPPPSPSAIHQIGDINYAPAGTSYGPPPEYGSELTRNAPSDEIKFIIYKPENEEVIKDTLIQHAHRTGEKIKFIHGPNLEIKHDQKVYLPPPRKSIIYILLKEPEIHTKVQVMGGHEEGAKPEVFIIYETNDGVIRKHYDLTEEESLRVVKALGDKMRLAKRGSSSEEEQEVNEQRSKEVTSSSTIVTVTSSSTKPTSTTTPKSNVTKN